MFESHGDAWWASRALAQLSPAANYLGAWEQGLQYCRRMVELGTAVDDLRLKVSALVRTASTHVHRLDQRGVTLAPLWGSLSGCGPAFQRVQPAGRPAAGRNARPT